MTRSDLSRRRFLQLSAMAVGGASLPSAPSGAPSSLGVTLVVSPNDRVASTAPVRWALGELRQALTTRGIPVTQAESVEKAPSSVRILVGVDDSPFAAPYLTRAGVPRLATRESIVLLPLALEGGPALLASGGGMRGLEYALLELAERVEYAGDPMRALETTSRIREEPFNAVRAIGRPFVSDVEDKGWFTDRAFWPDYFAMLARQRINRFHLSLGFGYDTLRNVTDAYLLFPYPFLVSVPGYDVHAVNLPDGERDRNLEMLRFISSEAAAHGLDFQLGVWTHGYTWDASPNANYTIVGLNPGNQAAYCRDALTAVLRECPDIAGVTLRTHYESGVKEGSYAFWKTIFEGVPASGRTLEVELHAKGLDRKLVDTALSVGMPVRLSAKYWAEHTGLPYHQAAIRELELPHGDAVDAFAALSLGSRNHTRYGYADFLEEQRPYGVMYRVFPGTHKFLLWGDPITAAAHARAFGFCGSDGAELLEPLSFKGRRGSGVPGGRDGYADRSLAPRRDWEKFLYTYTLWGRLLYNPEADPDTWRRLLRRQYRWGAPAMETALGQATRILPIVTTAHLPSAAHDAYSPEFYTNQSIVNAAAASPYGDTPAPRVFSTVSPLDPQLFSTIDEWVAELLDGEPSGKYSPGEVAGWIENLAESAAARLAEAARAAATGGGPELRRAGVDIRVQVGLGRFFALKLRSGALFVVYQKTGSREALDASVRLYREAREAWAALAREARAVYVEDITFGPLPHQRGHWQDRLAAIDTDIAAMEKTFAANASSEHARAVAPGQARAMIAAVLNPAARQAATCRHTPPGRFVPGTPLRLSLAVDMPESPTRVRVLYRHVNQAERYETAEMRLENGEYGALIPADYTESRFPLQYYFEIKNGRDHACLFPGFNRDLTNQPYFVVRQGK